MKTLQETLLAYVLQQEQEPQSDRSFAHLVAEVIKFAFPDDRAVAAMSFMKTVILSSPNKYGVPDTTDLDILILFHDFEKREYPEHMIGKEIARHLSLSYASVRQRLSRMRQRYKQNKNNPQFVDECSKALQDVHSIVRFCDLFTIRYLNLFSAGLQYMRPYLRDGEQEWVKEWNFWEKVYLEDSGEREAVTG